MYYHRILVSSIISYVLAVPVNAIIATAEAYVPKIRHPVLVCRSIGQAHFDSVCAVSILFFVDLMILQSKRTFHLIS